MDTGSSALPPYPYRLHPRTIFQGPYVNLSALLETFDLYTVEDALSNEDTFVQLNLKSTIIDVALSTTFFGVFTVLAVLAVYVLFSKGMKRKTTGIMILAVTIMWTSAVVDWAATLFEAAAAYTVVQRLASQSFAWISAMDQCLYSALYDDPPADCSVSYIDAMPNSDTYGSGIRECMGAATLMVNILLGDSIVWWRAWALWPYNRVMRMGGIIMILLTTTTSIMNTKDGCQSSDGDLSYYGTASTSIMTGGDIWGIATGLSSLLTNTVATALIAYRAWQHRRIILSYLRSTSQRTQVERTLALLIESGVFYCALWVAIAGYELSSEFPMYTFNYLDDFSYVMKACLVPLLGMYPTLVIILCAADRSLHEKPHDDRERNAPIVFAGEPPSRTRETLSELLSATSMDTTSQDA